MDARYKFRGKLKIVNNFLFTQIDISYCELIAINKVYIGTHIDL